MNKYNISTRAKGFFLAFLGMIIMSLESPIIKITSLDAYTFGFYFGLFLALSSQMMLISRGFNHYKEAFSNKPKGIIVIGSIMAFSNFFFILAITKSIIANALLLFATAPIISAILAFVFFKIKTPKRILFSATAIIIGLSILFYNQIQSLDGLMYGILCVFCFSSFFVALSHFRGVNKIAYMSVAGFLLAFLNLIFGEINTIELKPLLIVAFMGMVITPLSRWLLGASAAYLVAAEISLIVIGESIVGSLFAWMLIGEVPPLSTLIAGVIILTALFINGIYSLRSK